MKTKVLSKQFYKVGDRFTDILDVWVGNDITIEIMAKWEDPTDKEDYYIVKCVEARGESRMYLGEVSLLGWFQIYKYYEEVK